MTVGTRHSIDLAALTSIVGESGVTLWDAIAPDRQHQIQRSLTPNPAVSAIVYPQSQAELAAVIACAQQNGWGILPSGAGSKLDWGDRVQNVDLVVSTARLNQLIEHAVGDLTVTVEAGMRFADLQATLATAGQFLAIDPMFPQQATIGGIVATADTGSLRQRYNSVRDQLLGLTIVRSDGQLAKAGGRVVKNVAGYDLMKLFTGSYGTLGIISQITFRVYPLPAASQTIILSGEADAIAKATSTLRSSALTPAAADLLSASVVRDLAIGTNFGLAVRFQSIESSVAQQIDRLRQVGETLGLTSQTIDSAGDAALWEQLRERMSAGGQAEAITCKIGIKPSESMTLLALLAELAPDAGGQIHTASGLGRLVCAASTSPDQILKLRSHCEANRGFLSILQAPAALKQQVEVWGYVGNAIDLMHRLKQQFDPQSLFSPHRLGDKI
jgi:glycolate oxidase FAD binding subunit